MEKQILEYKIICEEFAREVAREVNSAIKEGWTPYGYPIIGKGYVYQAMVKYERYA